MNQKDKKGLAEDKIGSEIARRAAGAFAKARKRALIAKQPIVVVKDGEIVRISPTGDREVVGKVKPPVHEMAIQFEKGVEIAIQWAESRD